MGRSLPIADPDGASAALPVELSSFVGREREVGELRRLLLDARLLTLTGAGGSGKTRLALELAHAPGLPPVAWAALAAIEDPAHLPRHVAGAFAIPEEVRGADVGALVALLRGRRALLVLDNCEHLVDACAELADALLRGCPELRILATSREPLGVRGERAWLVPALSLPEPGVHTAAAAAGAEAVRLFVERARDVLPSFELTDANVAAVVDVCRRLDGIPLAIELAAARARMLSPEQLRERLDDAFQLLTAGGRTAPPRHRTLRATMDWSHDLLGEESRALLRRLAVFRGGFTLDAVEAVGEGGSVGPGEALDLLGRLVDRSLVVVREQSTATRYDLLETVRQYAGGKLDGSGEGEAVRSRHAHWLLERVAEAEPHLIRSERPLWVGRLLPELDNLREALAWSRTADPDLHVALVCELWWLWFSTQHWTEARRWIDGALALPAAARPDRSRAGVLFASGALAALQARNADARPALEEAATLAAACGDERLAVYARNYLGMTYAGEGRAEARALCEAAADWYRREGDLYGLRLSLLLLGSTAAFEGRFEDALRFNEEGVAVARRFGLGRELAVALQNLAVVHLVRGRHELAEPLVREALAASRADPSYFFIATGLSYLGEAVGARGRPLEAARWIGASVAVRELVGGSPFPRDAVRQEAALAGFRAAVGADAFERAYEEGRLLDPERALAEVAAGGGPAAGPGPAAAPASGARDVGSPPPADLEARLLGPLDVRVEGRALDAASWSYAKPKELLAWLLLNPAGGTRDDVGRALWPDASPAQVKNSFHVTAHHLRKALGGSEWIVLEGARYRLSPDRTVRLDAARFEREARAALREGADEDRLGRVLDLYRGDLLEGEVVGGWALDERDRLRALQVEVTLALGRRVEEAGDDAGAAALYHAVAVREELHEEAHRRLMTCWARSGERARALRWYERVVETLRSALDAEPEAETTALWERIRGAG